MIQNNIKKPAEIEKLNFNDVAFFFNESSGDAKWRIAPFIFGSPKILENNLTKSGVPKISSKEFVFKKDIDIKIKSCSALDGLNMIDYTIETYNKGIPADRLIKYKDNSTFAKALKFTGKYSILNDILNKEQFLTLKKSWLLQSLYSNNTFINFQAKNDWAAGFVQKKNAAWKNFTNSKAS